MSFAGITLGSPYARRMQGQAMTAQTNLAQQQAADYSRFMPQVLANLSGMMNETPSYYNRLREQQTQDVTTGLRQAFGDLRSGYTQRGMSGSGAYQDALSRMMQQGGMALARVAPSVQQQQDERMQRLIAALGGMAGGAGQNAMAGYGAVGNTAAAYNAESMAPFYALMQMIGAQMGQRAGMAAGGGFGGAPPMA